MTPEQETAIADSARELNTARQNWFGDRTDPKRTLTELYNERPDKPRAAWLTDAHRTLDAAVSAAYGWPSDLTDDQILQRLLDLNKAAEGSAAK